MGQPYSVLLGELRLTTAAATTLFTVPDGKVAILRDVDVVMNNGGASALYLRDDDLGYPFVVFSVAAGTLSVAWRGRQVFPAGMSCVAIADPVGGTVVRASGYLLDA